jgi:hypothetical protein
MMLGLCPLAVKYGFAGICWCYFEKKNRDEQKMKAEMLNWTVIH